MPDTGLAQWGKAVVITNDATHEDKEGYAVLYASGEMTLVSSDTALTPFGVIQAGALADGDDTIVPVYGGAICKIKLAASPGTVTAGVHVGTHTDGSFKATASSKNAMAVALETGTADELIDAILYPAVLTA